MKVAKQTGFERERLQPSWKLHTRWWRDDSLRIIPRHR